MPRQSFSTSSSDARQCNASNLPVVVTSDCQDSMATSKRSVTINSDAPRQNFRCPTQKRDNYYKRLVRLGGLYKGLTLSILVLLESRGTPYTLKKHLEDIQVQIDHILRFRTYFVCESARLAQI